VNGLGGCRTLPANVSMAVKAVFAPCNLLSLPLMHAATAAAAAVALLLHAITHHYSSFS